MVFDYETKIDFQKLESLWNISSDNLCYQKEPEFQLVDFPCTKEEAEAIKKEWKIDVVRMFWYCIPTSNKEKYIPPKLKKCEKWEKPWNWYKNCCPEEEYDTYIFQKYLEKKWIESKKYLKEFYEYSQSKKQEIFQKLIKIEKKIKEIKTETQKSVIIPVDKPLTIEQMWFLEATIYGTFIIVKSLVD